MLPAVIVFLLAVFLSQSDAYCFFSTTKSKDCVYKGRSFPNGALFISSVECLRCVCKNGSFKCCSIGMYISSYPSYCKVIPYGPCFQKAVMIDNHNKPCAGPISIVGR